MATTSDSTGLESWDLGGFIYFKEQASKNLSNVRFASGTVLKEKVMVEPLGMGARGHIPALT